MTVVNIGDVFALSATSSTVTYAYATAPLLLAQFDLTTPPVIPLFIKCVASATMRAVAARTLFLLFR